VLLSCDNVGMIGLQFVKMENWREFEKLWTKNKNGKTSFCFCL